MSAVMQLPGSGQTVSFAAKGAVDNAARRGELTLDMSSLASAFPLPAGPREDPGLWRGKEVFHASNGLVVKYPNLLPESQRSIARAAVKALTKVTGESTFPVDVWVDSRQLVRRLKMVMVMKAPQGSMTMWLTADFFGFGAPVNVELPAADQVTDLAELAGAS